MAIPFDFDLPFTLWEAFKVAIQNWVVAAHLAFHDIKKTEAEYITVAVIEKLAVPGGYRYATASVQKEEDKLEIYIKRIESCYTCTSNHQIDCDMHNIQSWLC